MPREVGGHLGLRDSSASAVLLCLPLQASLSRVARHPSACLPAFATAAFLSSLLDGISLARYILLLPAGLQSGGQLMALGSAAQAVASVQVRIQTYRGPRAEGMAASQCSAPSECACLQAAKEPARLPGFEREQQVAAARRRRGGGYGTLQPPSGEAHWGCGEHAIPAHGKACSSPLPCNALSCPSL
jgi:hypothetical protein